MAEYRNWIRVAWTKSAPYAQELFSNENYVYTSAIAMNALFSFSPFVILIRPLTIAVAWMTWVYFGGMILVLGANLMARRALNQQVERMKETLWNFRTELPS